MIPHSEPTTDAPIHPFDRLPARLTLLVALAGALPGMLLVWFWRGHFSAAWTIGGIAIYGLVVLALFAWGRSRGVRFARVFGPPPTPGDLALAVGLAVAGLAFSLGTLLALIAVVALANPAIFDMVRDGAPAFVVRSQGQVDVVSTILRGVAVALCAPFVEELLFRGLVFTRWSRRFGVARGIVFSALLFGLLHLSLQPLGAFVLGLSAAVLYVRTGSLWPAIVAHVTNNTIVVLATSWGEQQMAGAATLPEGNELKGLLLLGVVLFAISAPILYVVLRRLWPPRDAIAPYDAAPAGP